MFLSFVPPDPRVIRRINLVISNMKPLPTPAETTLNPRIRAVHPHIPTFRTKVVNKPINLRRFTIRFARLLARDTFGTAPQIFIAIFCFSWLRLRGHYFYLR